MQLASSRATRSRSARDQAGVHVYFVQLPSTRSSSTPRSNQIRGNDIVYKNHYDIGVAVSTARAGVPVLAQAS